MADTSIDFPWFHLHWPETEKDHPSAPFALLSLAAAGDMVVKPEPGACVREETSRLFPGKKFIWLKQEHTHTVLEAEASAAGVDGDGLVTDNPDILIGVTVADCMPIFLWDVRSGAKAVLHSGWKGTGISREALKIMKTLYGTHPEDVSAILGPSIRSCCYAVSRERAESFAEEFGEDAAFLRNGNWYIDLAAANRNILREQGVVRIKTHPECTACDTRFSSYRRQGKECFTRMLALCC